MLLSYAHMVLFILINCQYHKQYVYWVMKVPCLMCYLKIFLFKYSGFNFSIALFTGLSSIRDKLEALLPLLIHCFEEFGATGHATDTIDAQLFTCMLYVLRIIRMLVKILFPQKDQSSRSVRSIVKDQETSNYSALISLKKLWELFPVCSDYQSLEMVSI